MLRITHASSAVAELPMDACAQARRLSNSRLRRASRKLRPDVQASKASRDHEQRFDWRVSIRADRLAEVIEKTNIARDVTEGTSADHQIRSFCRSFTDFGSWRSGPPIDVMDPIAPKGSHLQEISTVDRGVVQTATTVACARSSRSTLIGK